MLKKKLYQSQLSALVDEVTRIQSLSKTSNCSQKSIH